MSEMSACRTSGLQHGIGPLRRVGWRSSMRVCAGLLGQVFQLLGITRIAKDHFMASSREQGAQLAAHESRAKNADAHVLSVLVTTTIVPKRQLSPWHHSSCDQLTA